MLPTQLPWGSPQCKLAAAPGAKVGGAWQLSWGLPLWAPSGRRSARAALQDVLDDPLNTLVVSGPGGVELSWGACWQYLACVWLGGMGPTWHVCGWAA